MRQEYRQAKRIWNYQAGLVLVITLLLSIYADRLAAMSALLGGVVFLLPNRLLLAKLFQQQNSVTARQIVKQLYWGEIIKITMTLLLLTLIFSCLRIAGLPFFLTYLAAQAVYWFALIFRYS